MQILIEKECYQLIKEMGMLEHIIAHSCLVCQVALCLTEHLKEKNVPLNSHLIQASALLHDITKTRSLTTGEQHALTGSMLLKERGYPEVGDIIEQHVWLNPYPDSDPPTAAEIVNYADKRVLHDNIASLEDRMVYIFEKYGKKPEHREKLYQLKTQTETLETKLFRWLSFSPDDLGELVENEKELSFLSFDNL